jgi:hypothetical protein
VVWHLFRVMAKPHVLDISLASAAPAYMEEQFPITVEIRNDDSRAFDVWIDVLLYPTEDPSGERGDSPQRMRRARS